MITLKTAHRLINMLQTLMGYIETEEIRKAKDMVHLMGDFIKLEIEQKAQRYDVPK